MSYQISNLGILKTAANGCWKKRYSEHHKNLGPTSSRSICLSDIEPNTGLFRLETESSLLAVNALAQSWRTGLLYAFPPFALIGRCLQKIRAQLSLVILIAPICVNQPWYPVLLQMLSDHPRMLSMNPSLLRNPQGESHPLLENGSLRLAAWLVSGDPQQQRDYQALLNTSLKTSKLKELESVLWLGLEKV